VTPARRHGKSKKIAEGHSNLIDYLKNDDVAI